MARNRVDWDASIVPRVVGLCLINRPGFRFAVIGFSPHTPFQQPIEWREGRAIALYWV